MASSSYCLLFCIFNLALSSNDWCGDGVSCENLSVSLLQSSHRTVVVNKHDRREQATKYFWPTSVGKVGSLTSSQYSGPQNLSASLAWNWTDPRGRYYGLPAGAAIDAEKNIYLQTNDAVRKLTSGGELVWEWFPKRNITEEMPDMGSLSQGAFYVSTTAGWIYAISMAAGDVLWKTKLPSTDGNNGWVTVHEGVVLTGSDARFEYKGQPRTQEITGSADQFITGLNASDGKVMWNFKPDAPVWNFMGSFAGERGTFFDCAS